MLIPSELDEDVFPECSWTYIGYKDHLKPNKYLQDAIDDLNAGKERRNLNNAIRNAKAALHMRVDILCISFSGNVYFKKLKTFPRKMDFLESIGIVRPRIIDKINKLRNELEHEYRDATLEEAEDFIDIVLLFIEATKYLNTRFPSDSNFYGVVSSNGDYLRGIVCKWDIGELILYFSKDDFGNNYSNKHTLKVGDEQYSQWVKYLIENCD
ncbi:hypothetical protein [Serratia marcescens]|uniref:hypothetical protein n=3 Tax=Serratia marcescens TaxID=615 RepID=UPI002B2642BC|nr:hypothetical protein [Serratia marcescens]WPJ24073.1 hypothetical protein NAE95_00305 [Serratia marcescens]